MPTRIIFVSRNGNSNNIKLRDSEGHNPQNDDLTTGVKTGDTVLWVLDENSGLSSINKIERAIKPSDPNTVNVLKSTPRKLYSVIIGDVVDTSPGKNKHEDYRIFYNIEGQPIERHDDPKLKMDD